MALNFIRVASHLRVTNSEEEYHIEILMNIAEEEVDRIASGAPESDERAVRALVDCVELCSNAATVLEIQPYPQIRGTRCGALSLLKPWRKIRAGRVQGTSE